MHPKSAFLKDKFCKKKVLWEETIKNAEMKQLAEKSSTEENR